MRHLTLVLLAALAAVLPASSASARAGGCWATVTLSPLPRAVHAGDLWVVDVTVRQHGRTLLRGAKPVVRIHDASGETTRFAARPTAKRGVYRARVVFPTAGRWAFTVFDGFVPHCARTHTFAAITTLP